MLGVPQPNNASPYNLYSGYIGGWAYRTQATDDASVLRDGMLLGERFRYDKIGRLRSDTTYSFDGTSWVSDGNGGWGTRYVLDQNSNMIHIKRWALNGNSTSVLYDDATLSLSNGQSNALLAVSDASGNVVTGYDQELDNTGTGDIDVDAKGRVTQSEMGEMANTTAYTSYDVPNAVTRGTNDIAYVRNAFGEIVRVDVATNSTWTHSISIIPGSVIADQAVYLQNDDEGTPTIAEWSVVGHSRISINRGTGATTNGNIYYRNIGHIRYELTDHLGSIRALLSDVKLIVSGEYKAKVLSTADYEPYGATRSQRSLELANETTYRYSFQGMRLLEGSIGLSEYRTPFRLYDGRTGRWAGLDLVQQPWTSPYEGLGSLPTYWTDVWGLRIDESGHIVKDPVEVMATRLTSTSLLNNPFTSQSQQPALVDHLSNRASTQMLESRTESKSVPTVGPAPKRTDAQQFWASMKDADRTTMVGIIQQNTYSAFNTIWEVANVTVNTLVPIATPPVSELDGSLGDQSRAERLQIPIFMLSLSTGSVGKMHSVFVVEARSTFFEGAQYSDKVLRQMSKADDVFHAFPKSVDGYATKYGQWSTKLGADGKPYEWLKMPGSYRDKKGVLSTGVFEYTKDVNGHINHRFFNVPKAP